VKKRLTRVAAYILVAVACTSVILYAVRARSQCLTPREREGKAQYTFLVCGLDKASRSTDVILLASVNTEKGGISILQIPRDTFVNPVSSGLGITRVNAVYGAEYARADGEDGRERRAMEGLCRFVSGALSVEIDRYVLMDTDAFVSIIDAVGGVEYDVPFDMDYDDPFQGLSIHLKAGRQTLCGASAEQLIRYRSGYATGDLGRVSAREGFLHEVFTQVKEKMSVGSAVRIAAGLIGSVITNVSPTELAYFASALYKADDVNIKTISGSAVQNPKTGAWIYYALNRRAALDDINEYITPVGAEIPLADFDKNAVFADDPLGENPYISKYYYS
jgi:LCP family protein required for cell wall assembly